MKAIITFILILGPAGSLFAQATKIAIEPGHFTAFNRMATYENGTVHLDSRPGDGVLWLSAAGFENGIIELQIKGKNLPGKSFVGVAFHGKDNETYDAIYFRPFNFRNPERNTHAIQYIAMPENDWATLRKEFPGKYENTILPVPEPVNDWFDVKIEVKYPRVSVYINGAVLPTLEVDQISTQKRGKVGFWVGNGSEGWFRQLKITGISLINDAQGYKRCTRRYCSLIKISKASMRNISAKNIPVFFSLHCS